MITVQTKEIKRTAWVVEMRCKTEKPVQTGFSEYCF